jgi:serine/threonine-protein kinase HipA
VARYDREIAASGEVRRIHQEDLCQATGTSPKNKYQDDAAPSLRQIATILTGFDLPSVVKLLQAVTLHVLVGNGAAHAKNYSLLHGESGSVALAPLYDVMSTLIYGDDRLALYIDNVHRTDQVTGDRLLNEATSWGLSPTVSAEIIRELLDRACEASEHAAEETPGAPNELREIVESQARLLRSGL